MLIALRNSLRKPVLVELQFRSSYLRIIRELFLKRVKQLPKCGAMLV